MQPVFRLFSEAVPTRGEEPRDHAKLARYLAARDKLGLLLVDAEGQVIETTAIHIADYVDEQGAPELDVLISDDDYWKHRGV